MLVFIEVGKRIGSNSSAFRRYMNKLGKSHSQRFIDLTDQSGADGNEDASDEKLKRIAQKKKIQHASDCAVHNAPAMEPGRCTCGAIRGQ